MSDVVEFDPSKRRRKARPLPGPSWERGLLRGPTGALKKLVANVILVLSNSAEWKGAIAWDEFAERLVIVRPCPCGGVGHWRDNHDVLTAAWLQRSELRLEVGKDLVAEAALAVGMANSVHPLRARLDDLVWDKKTRVDTWTTTYLGAADTEVHREMGLRWMLGAVSRAFVPGSKVDCALILEGPQGLGKSSAVKILSLGFFTDELADIGSKDAAMQLHGAWIVELPELDAMGRAETSKVKAFLTRTSDRYRAPYGRHVADHPRQCTYVGTVNHNDYLRDETGGRRFLPIEAVRIDRAALERDVEQLWAEAVVRFRAGELAYTSNARVGELISAHTATRYQGDVWHDHVKAYAETFKNVSVDDCLAHVGVDRAKRGQSDAIRVAKILKSIGFTRKHLKHGETYQWRYVTSSFQESGSSAYARNDSDRSSDPVDPVRSNRSTEESAGEVREPTGRPDPTGSLDRGGDRDGCFDDLIGGEP